MKSEPLRIMLYVQHLLGIGHLVRSSRIARALAASGMETLLVTGGLPVPGLDIGRTRLFRLPPVKSGEDGFSTLVHGDGQPFTDADRAARRDTLLAVFDGFLPDALVIEAFPFGRRQMRFEVLPLLERAKARSILIASSVRDILQEQKKPEQIRETVAWIEQFFDLVLVHGEGDAIRLDETFPLATRFAEKIAYTGLVGGSDAVTASSDRHEVIVSVGGGAVGARLIEEALGAKDKLRASGSPMANWRWLIVTGPNYPEARMTILKNGDDGLTIERFLPDLPQRFKNARLSVSQAGYNTVADVLGTGCAAVFVPFAAGGETEQSLRARALASRGACIMLKEDDLSADTLAEAMEQALALPKREGTTALDGAAETARIMTAALRQRPPMRV